MSRIPDSVALPRVAPHTGIHVGPVAYYHQVLPFQHNLSPQPTGSTGVKVPERTLLRSLPRRVAGWPTLSVRNYLSVIALVAVIPLIALAAYVGDLDARSERDALRTALMSSARSLAAAVDREIDKHVAIAATLTHSRLLREERWSEYRTQANEALSFLPGAGLIVADPAGHQLLNLSRGQDDAMPVRPAAALQAERRAFATGQPQVSDIFVGRHSRQPIAAVDAPVFRDGAPLYTISIQLDPAKFRAMLNEQHYAVDWYAGIVDRNGVFVARLHDPDGKLTSQPAGAEWRDAMDKNAEGIVRNRALDQEPLITAYTRTAHGWTVGVAISESALNAPLWRTRLMVAIAALGCLGLSLLLIWAVARKFDLATQSLKGAAKAMADALPVAAPQATRIREYDEVGTAFADASTLLKARENERERAEDALGRRVEELAAVYEFTEKRFRATSVAEIGDAALDAVVTALRCDRASILLLDAAGVMRFVAWRGLSDRYRAAVEGHSPWRSDDKDPKPVVIGDVAAADLPDGIRAAAIQQNIRALAFIPVIADGSLIGKFMTYYDAPHAFTEGEMMIAVNLARRLGFAIAHKRADEARIIATRELQHRCNNLLAVIQAIAHTTLVGESLEGARSAFEARLQALARAHRQLLKSNWTGVNLDELVRQSLEPFATRSEIEGGDVTLNPKDAQNLSLALHELATNSVKHGALSRPDGRVNIAWAVRGAGSGRVLNFQWQERGGPEVVTPSRRGFGTTLLKATFGDVRLDYAPEGLMCEIDVPLGNPEPLEASLQQ
jgi:two-component sensor histidine kinase